MITKEAFKELVEKSELFDPYSGLPIIYPRHTQPHMHHAIVKKCANWIGLEDPWAQQYVAFCNNCQMHNGIYSRFPGGLHNLSPDELIGMLSAAPEWLRKYVAESVLDTLRKHWGRYPNELGEVKWKRWWYRFPYLVPMLKAAAGHKLNWFNRRMFQLHLWNSKRINKSETFEPSGVIKVWLINSFMTMAHRDCAWRLSLWREAMVQQGIHPRRIFSFNWLNECPTLKEIAPPFFT